MKRAIVSCALAGLVTACNPVVPDSTAQPTTTQKSTSAENAGTAAAAGYGQDPLAPNWEVKEVKLADNQWRLDMRMKRWTTGGDGEAIGLLHRQAQRLAQLQGYSNYRILAWNEGIESAMPIARRWARGVVLLEGSLPPMPKDKP
jgi:hypothetical protein